METVLLTTRKLVTVEVINREMLLSAKHAAVYQVSSVYCYACYRN